MNIAEYLKALETRHKTGISREHSYRGDLQNLLSALLPDVLVTNEPARVECGAPDYIITRKDIPVGYIEAKDLGADLKSKSYKEQFDRYKASLPNLCITNYLDFHFYKDGELTTTVSLGEVDGQKVVAHSNEQQRFLDLIQDFGTQVGTTIRSANKLSQMMAGKARLMKEVFQKALEADIEDTLNADTALKQQFNAFQDVLIHDITPKGFADIYAQTIAYGMFAARLHDTSLENFSRQEAAELIPKTNPFLRKLFQYIAGYDLDDRLAWVVDSLADIFLHTDVKALLKNFGKATAQHDPIIHFYETFLGAYDKKLKKARGVWYTPEPVVNFIVRAVDDILKTEFGLKDGLADTSKTKVTVKVPTHDKRYKAGQRDYEQEVHKVQILDPATGTGTFLAEVIKQIHQKFKGQEGIWSQYVENDLIPRLNGFEILMASYAMAHLKLDMLLTETGYKPQKEQRFRVYLTNSLEEHHPDTGTLFAGWLSSEANEANQIKRDTPVMVVLGNPPYSVSSSNKGEWIQNLIKDYKRGLNEKKTNLDDDYIKFLRYGQYFIEKNGEGILAFVTNNSYVDGVTHRVMRERMLKSFDSIFILNLFGDAKKSVAEEITGKDENVFDIQQGVCISILVKKSAGSNKSAGSLYSLDLIGSRQHKYNRLNTTSINDNIWKQIKPRQPYFFFIEKNYKIEKVYNKGLELSKLFLLKGSGIKTERDSVCIMYTLKDIQQVVSNFSSLSEQELRQQYDLKKDSRDWKLTNAIADIQENFSDSNYSNIYYRPFDSRYTCYTGTTRGFIGTPGRKIATELIKPNLGLIMKRSRLIGTNTFQHCVITDQIVDINFLGDQSYIFPLYQYIAEDNQIFEKQTRTPNLNMELVTKVAEELGLIFVSEKRDQNGNVCFTNDSDVRPEFRTEFAPIDLLDYIYSVLHNPSYREKYKEFLKIDFPRVPYPKDKEKFWQLVALGSQLRGLHLLESEQAEKFITTYPKAGSNEVERKMTKNSIGYESMDETHGRVWINDVQYFDKVPEVAWNFYIGGYQPARKWLKDRKGRQLSIDDVMHYQKIIVALTETDRLMKEIDKIEIG